MRFRLFVAVLAAVVVVGEVIAGAKLVPGVQVAGEWLSGNDLRGRGLVITEHTECRNGDTYRSLELENRSDTAVRIEEVGWRRPEDSSDGLEEPGLTAWLEGWQMSTPCGLRTADDCDFEFNPAYLPFAVASPRDYRCGEKGVFRAENLVMFRNPATSTVSLLGFVSGAKNFGHFRIRLTGGGLKELDVLCDVGVELRRGERLTTDTLHESYGQDTERLLDRYATELGTRAKARKRFAPPVGWCSWYYYFEKVTLADVRRNVDWLKAHRQDGFEKIEYIQTDDGYQRALGDWLETNEKFPGGVEALAEVCRQGGFKAGLWVGPFMAEEGSHLLVEHPDWMIHDRDGSILYPFKWREKRRVAVLDGTHPGVQDHFRRLFGQLRAKGFDYAKLDFLMLAGAVQDGVLHDRTATRAEALCRGLKAIREGFGNDGFILGCTTPLLQTVGLVDANRVSADITPCWDHGPGKDSDEGQTVPNVCRNVIGHAYMNGRLWINDPDALIVREDSNSLTQKEVELWTDAVRLTGGALLLSDNFVTISDVRRSLVLKALRDMNRYRAFPQDRWVRTVPEVWKVEDGNGNRLTLKVDFASHSSSLQLEERGAGRPDVGYEKAKAASYARMSEAEMAAEERTIARRVFDLELVPPKMVKRPPEERYAPQPPKLTFLSYAVRSRVHEVGVDEPRHFAMNNGVAATRGGRIWRTWTGGEDGPESFTLGACSDDGGITWSDPLFMVDGRFGSGWMKGVPLHRYVLFSSLWTDPDGRLHLLVTQFVAHPNGRGSTWEFVCDDPDAKDPEWSPPRYLWHAFTHNKPLFLKDGTWILPIATEADPNGLWPDLADCQGGGVLISGDKGRTWNPGGFVKVTGTDHWCETTVTEREDGRLWMVLRTGLGPMESFSADGGKSWNELMPCAWFRNPVARHTFIKLRDGTLLLVKNGDDLMHFDDNYSLSGNGRNKLKAYFSYDDGRTWSVPVDLDLRDGAAYPDACEMPDGSVYVTWEYDRRGEAKICGKLLDVKAIRSKGD